VVPPRGLAGAGGLESSRPRGADPPLAPGGQLLGGPLRLVPGTERRFIFLEEYPCHTQRGRISVLELGADLTTSGTGPVPVLDEDRHLSYPFLFSFEGELYMVPESAASRRVDLYRCQSFPDRWTHVRTLIAGLQAADATLFEHEGRWWLFCSARQGRARLNNSLLAFHADSPLSDRWLPHARNPLVRDYGGGRPGGRVFVDEQGRLLRPAQNSVPRYGHGLVLNQVQALTPRSTIGNGGSGKRPAWRAAAGAPCTIWIGTRACSSWMPSASSPDL
jgi:hypothetical protein